MVYWRQIMAEKSLKKNAAHSDWKAAGGNLAMQADNKIAFFLPSRENGPIGGYKIVYEYANRFAEAGYDVSIIYPLCQAEYVNEPWSVFTRLKRYAGFYYRRLRGVHSLNHTAAWFDLNPRIKKVLVFGFTDFFVRKLKTAKVVATALRTAYELAAVTSIPEKNKFYFIQDFEAWGVSDEVVYESYRLPLKKITIAPWLQERVRCVGQDAVLVPNGFDFEYFKLTNPIEARCPTEVAMLYHKDDRKRCLDSMAALERVKEEIPELHVTMFGTPEKPDTLPDWYTYHQCPDRETHNAVYNNAAIFVAASKAEGMALPPAEAMICGAVLCCTDIGGFALYAIHDKTALLSPVFDVESLAHNIITLIKDDSLRTRLAKAGNEYIRQFTWEKAFSMFRNAIEG